MPIPELLNKILATLGSIAASFAIALLGAFCLMSLFTMVKLLPPSIDNEPPKAESLAWAGLILLAVWMACEIGRIGL